MKLTRHNGRAGKNGAYNPKHNDRRYDVENSGHIDPERAKKNIYWDCYQGLSGEAYGEGKQKYSFEDVERIYYFDHYADHVQAQNERNEKSRHTERNRTVEDLLKNKKTCPEETVYQIGTIEETVSGETLAMIAVEFFAEMEKRYGEHFHILDWALHVDEGTPHIHERHVFDCENRYGELCPQQEKALEELGVPLPYLDKPKGRNNNRKQTFDADCREPLFSVCEKHRLHLEWEPSYGGRGVSGKADIIEKQKEKAAFLEALAEAKAQASEPTIPELLARYMEQRGEERSGWTSRGKLKGTVSDYNKVQEAMDFLRQKGISTVETLDVQLDGISEKAVSIRDGMKKTERRIKDIDTLLSHIGNYEKYKPVYAEYAAIGWKKKKEKFEENHKCELDAYRAAAHYFKANLSGTSYSRKELEAEKKQLAAALPGKREELEAVQADVKILRDVRHWLNQVLPPEQYRQTAEPGKKPSLWEGLKGREQRIRQEQAQRQQPTRAPRQQNMEH